MQRKINLKHTVTEHWKMIGVTYVIQEWVFGFILHFLNIYVLIALIPYTILSIWFQENLMGKERFHYDENIDRE